MHAQQLVLDGLGETRPQLDLELVRVEPPVVLLLELRGVLPLLHTLLETIERADATKDALAQELDPHGKFRNEWAAEMIFGEGAEEEAAVAAAEETRRS